MSESSENKFWSKKISCPKCCCEMEQIKIDLVELDRCPSCQGLWFDARELDMLRKQKAARVVDTGNPELGEYMNQTDRYSCPRCSGSMLHLVDPGQPHIWYETCASCRGTFLDAGEFVDLTDFSLADLLKRFNTTERR